MPVIIQSPHLQISASTRKLFEEKFQRFDKLFDRIERCHIVLKKEKNQNQDVCIVEARLVVPGNDLFALEQAERFPVAAEMVCVALENQIKKHKAKLFQKRAKRADPISTEEIFE